MGSGGGDGGGAGTVAASTFNQIRGLAHKIGNGNNIHKKAGRAPSFIKQESPEKRDRLVWFDERGRK